MLTHWTIFNSIMELSSQYCASHDLFSAIPALHDTVNALNAEENELVSAGCPCDISGLWPEGGDEEGGFNVTVTISGLETSRPQASGLTCLFNDLVSSPAHVVSEDSVICLVPALPAVTGTPGLTTSSGDSGAGAEQLVSVYVLGASFKVTRSKGAKNLFRYFAAPTLDFASLLPGATLKSAMSL